MPPKVYIETTIPSYLTARPNRDIIITAHQQITHEWWDRRRSEFDLNISQFVVDECQAGDSTMARMRLDLIQNVPMLEVVPAVFTLAERLISRGPLPKKAETDALHISVAAVNSMDYLLTWNLKHIANVTMEKAIAGICRDFGFEPPVLCTPEDLLED